jgi:hypothetical protein
MDPIAAALIAAIANLSSTVIKDAYDGIKSLLVKKFGAQSKVVQAVDELQAEPDSQGRQAVLNEQLGKANAAQDPELKRLADELLEKLKALPGGQNVINQTVKGSRNNVVGQGNITYTEK